MESVSMDEVDRGLLHAFQLDGRAPLSKIAEVLGVSERTIARRYQRLRTSGVLRVVGTVDGARLGYHSWTIRLQCTPDAAGSVAAALARRADTFWVHLLSGGTEISCTTQTPTPEERDALLLQKLPRTHRVVSVTAHSMLHVFAKPIGWAALSSLSPEQAEKLRPPTPAQADDEPPVLTEADEALLDVLSRDGRATYAELSAVTRWSESTVKRRMDQLRHSGVLSYMIDIPPEVLGYRAEARLWMSVAPSDLVSVANTLAQHPEVSFAAVTTGSTNLMAAVICRDTRDLYRYLTERIPVLDAVRHLETAPVIRTVKRAGAVLPI